MTKKIFLFLLILVLSMCFPINALAADIPQKVIDAADSVFFIETANTEATSTGTGFIVKNDADGVYLITNNHVISLNVRNVFVWIGEKEKTVAEIVKNDEKYDLALLKINAPITARPMVFSKDAERGDSVYTIGFPAAADILSNNMAHLGKDATITDGIISNIRPLQLVEFGPEISILQINAAINFGNSGGPLVDNEGSVLGINTLGVMEAQGIFGSISTADLEEFLSGTGISLIYPQSQGVPVFVWLIAAAAVLAGMALLVILLLKKRHHKNKDKKQTDESPGIPLEAYLEQYNGSLNPKSITSLMMPLALHLRDKHLAGELSLKLSPKYIAVTEKGCVLTDQHSDDGFVQQKFLAPEQLSNELAGVYSDIYSLCAIMDYMLAKAPYEAENSAEAATWEQIIKKGMSCEPEQRFPTMQELVFALSPFNIGITPELFVKTAADQQIYPAFLMTDTDKNAAPPPRTSDIEQTGSFYPAGADIPFPETAAGPVTELPKKLKKKKRSKAFIIGLTAILVVAAAAIYGGVNYVGARVSISHKDFKKADTFLNLLIFDDQLLQDDRAYVNAGVDLGNQEFDKAIYAFILLHDLYDSREMVKEGKYEKGAYEVNRDNYDAAIALYQELGDYKDSSKLVGDTIYRKGYYLIDQKKYMDGIDVIKSLKDLNYPDYDELFLDANYQCAASLISDSRYLDAYNYLTKASGYKDADSLLSELKNEMYTKAQDLYHNGSYNDAEVYFGKIQDYLNSREYIYLCNAHTNMFFNRSVEFSDLSLASLIGFEDAAELLVSTQSIAEEFLVGTWSGDGYYFKMKENYYITYDLPWFDFGDYYEITNGYLKYEDKETLKSRNLFFITVLSEDCISVYAYKNGGTYTLYRQ